MSFKKLQERAKKEWEGIKKREPLVISVGAATCGRSAGALSVLQTFKDELENRRIRARIVEVGCIGLCYVEPIVTITKSGHPGICYGNITPQKVKELIEDHIVSGKVLKDYALGTIGEGSIKGVPCLFQIPVLKPQVRRILSNFGVIDPTNIDHYIAGGGYSGLVKAQKMQPVRIISELERSGLRGRGGAGFPTWKKWQFCLNAKGRKKYIICNADEGDPGAFMNRSLLESDPHSVLEGLLIAGYTIGAEKGYIYCRAEYPLALERLKIALKETEKSMLLGNNICDSGFNFHIEIKQGAGAFVCGEETALIASIEGRRGMPNPRPPFPAISGLWGEPTIINNAETLASIASIFKNNADWFSQYGTQKSKGTKTFALAGKVKCTGLIEVPLGITLREVIYEIGGGILNDKKFKAVQTGGPSGGCLPASLLDEPIDYESLTQAGSIMGSGGMVVMDEDTCMVDIARYFLDFTQKESCGKCAPCRLGTKQMLDILNDITKGKGRPEDIDLLLELAEGIKRGSLCGLGQTAPNTVLTTIRYFQDEYKAHIKDRRCPSGVCNALISYSIDEAKCTGCGACKFECPDGAISGEKKKPHKIDQATCIKCGICKNVCRFEAVRTS
ncbi:NADH-ubiquinone oxidoreductase-F iron-sulfur binding region domain-containing protein [Candidatus Omnitrophota bacterium]